MRMLLLFNEIYKWYRMRTIAIGDSSIFIDLYQLEMLSYLGKLKIALKTTDFVLYELSLNAHQDQGIHVQKMVENGVLTVLSADVFEMQKIVDLKNVQDSLSLTDCSVWYYAKKLDAMLLTGDGKLRKSAEKDKVEVHGTLWIFDELIKQNEIAKSIAAQKLKELMELNPRLPQKICKERIANWEEPPS